MTCGHMRPGPSCALGKATPEELPAKCDGCRFGRGKPGPRVELTIERRPLPEVGPPAITLENAIAFGRAAWATMRRGRVAPELVEIRLAACLACPYRGQSSTRPDPVGYCLACRCGSGGALSRKASYREVRRPFGCLWPDGDEIVRQSDNFGR